ncbi:transcription termination/antitermination protein NusG [Pediococcus claussenii]|uniref:Transcription termination/antitermination protein NusG n=1 Tax=Pediococcus claussenii (strain ATCC BAA-344 / DSM 14800 / JCM 18046 / KCTC 3811 / LMG 21948 / P06) TaxID=701521 RepID=G8PBM4_PEDCP|nr:transcription termination/antitermination protein NusG [Pediococcus claussenii]AEV94773.1 transcription termination/antitermination factor NusG [Pediococcus claussenii ATCC BAA-344]ANZ69970.1 transcription termination/antitermination protein NusG [Pediococcus claussenii]ANZ71786.1 transcription termination/antitermination protein NusG [Pediococcus claussenii]KRN20952.1 nusG protein [Pediococcus claussenii]
METAEKNWYVLHTYSGYENKVKNNLDSRSISMGMQDFIFRVVVPEEEERETKNGKEKIVKKNEFPGYVLVEMVMTDDSWYVVRNTPGVTGFIGSHGSGSKPTPLLPDEVDTVLRRLGMTSEHVDIDVEVGEFVTITDGAFNGLTGKITEIDDKNMKVKVDIDMFGRETSTELDLSQIAKID